MQGKKKVGNGWEWGNLVKERVWGGMQSQWLVCCRGGFMGCSFVREEEYVYGGVDLWTFSPQRSAGNCLRTTGAGDLSRLPPALKIGPSVFLFRYWFCNREVRTFTNLSETEGWSLSGVGFVKRSIPNT